MAGKFHYKFRRIFLVLFAMMAVSAFFGCAKPRAWTKNGLNQEEFDKDFARCSREASSSTSIVDYANSSDLERGLDRSMTKDNLVKKCMYSKGYRLEE